MCVELISREAYSVTYRTNILRHPAFKKFSQEDLAEYLKAHPDGFVTIGGCSYWTPEQFIEYIVGEIESAAAWKAVFAEKDNFIRQAFGLRPREDI